MTSNQPRIGVSIAVRHAHNGHFLFVKRAKEPAKGMWAFPGGRLEFGETMIEGVKRELKEETGLQADNIAFFDHAEIIQRNDKSDVPAHHFLLCVHTGIAEGRPIAGDDAEEANWFSLEEIEALPVTPSTLAFAKRIAKGAVK